ncbi:MAG: FAD-dependent oxidoreductase [Candidatus Eisenbacteria bacterium]|nr:FAD-dependent oxidoreductase [Candidatus Eisenbacteria bacterium]
MELATLEQAKLIFEKGTELEIERISPSPCTLACPAGVNVKGYVSLIAEGRFVEALGVVRDRCPLPGVCGRVCNHPCESVCRRNNVDGAVSIRALKRFVADYAAELPPPLLPPKPFREERIAVVGSGPGGITAAYDLARAGFGVTLIESESKLGGMLRYGIPDYRLPPEVLDREIDALLGPSVQVRTNTVLGRDVGLDELLAKGHAAVFLAVGAMKSRRLGLHGEGEIQGVEDALAFLKRANEGDRTPCGERVLVIGGGSSAIDAARTALRLGARSADIVYRRSKEEMPAVEEEIRAAEAEGVGFRFLTAPNALKVENGRVVALECLEVRLGEPDASGRRRPIPVSGSEFTLRTDAVIASIGQEPNLPFLGSRYESSVDRSGCLIVSDETGLTRIGRVFAGGDAVTGPATVIEAIAAGHRAARAIQRLIEEGPDSLLRAFPAPAARWEVGLPDPSPDRHERAHAPELSLSERSGFEEVELAFTAEDAIDEASRCLRCGPCFECHTCVSTCPRRHVLVRSAATNGERIASIDLLLRTPREGTPAEARESEARGMLQVESDGKEDSPISVTVGLVKSRVDERLCRGCGRCIEVCAFRAPRLVPGKDQEPVSRIDPTLCRGCGLCVSVCSTGAAEIEPFSKNWILDSVTDASPDRKVGRSVVITCQRRGGCLAPAAEEPHDGVEIIRLSCVGQLEAGTILKLIHAGAEEVLVAGCAEERCRFEHGAGIAADQVELARALLRMCGIDPDRVRSDWSEGREGDPLILNDLVGAGGRS